MIKRFDLGMVLPNDRSDEYLAAQVILTLKLAIKRIEEDGLAWGKERVFKKTAPNGQEQYGSCQASILPGGN
jgi:hypothetical protein